MPAPGGGWGTDTWHVDAWGAGTWGVGVALALAASGAPLHAIDILDAPTCAGGEIVARATDCLARRALFTITGEDSFSVELPLTSTAANYVTSRYVVRAQFADDPSNFNEWRFLDDDAAVVHGGGKITATAYDLVNDLAAPGPIRDLNAVTGIPNFAYSVEATPTELIDTYILPRLVEKGYTWIARGTVDPTDSRLWEWNTLNPLELLRLISSVTSTEYRLRRNGTSGYLIDLVAAVNSALPSVEVRPGVNLREFRRSRKGANHYTAMEGFGSAGGDGKPATTARALWRVSAVTAASVAGMETWGADVWGADVWGAGTWGAGGTSVPASVTLADPSGVGPGPIIEDDQFVEDVGNDLPPTYLYRYNQGGIHEITSTTAATQKVEIASIDTYAVGDLVELRSGPGAAGYVNEVSDGWGTNLWAGKRVTNVDAGNLRLTVDDPWSDVAMVPLDDRYRGWTVRPYFRAASSSMSANVAATNPLHRQCTVGSTTGFLVGDLVYHSNNNPSGAPNWTLMTQATYEVVSVDSPTLVTVKYRRKTGAVPALTNTRFLSAWRPRTDRACTACVSSAGTIDVDDVTSIVVGDIVELTRKYDAPVMTELPSPSGILAHGVRVGRFDRDTLGETNLLAAYNPFFRDWTAGANALPDSWYGSASIANAARTFGLQNADAAYRRSSTFSVRIATRANAQINTGCAASGTSILLSAGAGSGTRFEVGESARLSAGVGNEETVVLTSVSADGLTIGFAPCANIHNAAELVQSVTTPASPTIVGASLSMPSLVSTPIDIPSLTGLDTYGVRVAVYLKGFVSGDTATVKLTLTNHPELGGTTAAASIVADPDTNATADAWNEIFIPLTQQIPGGRATVEVGASTTGTYPQDKAVYVDVVGLFQTSYDPGVVPEWSYATELHQATNAKLALVSQGAPASYDVGMVDLYGQDFRTWPHLQLIPGVTARVTEPAAGVTGVPPRITSVAVDYDRPGDTRVEMGTKHQRLTELLAHARVSVPVVRINTDGTISATTNVSQQGFTLPTTGTTPAPPVSLPYIIE